MTGGSGRHHKVAQAVPYICTLGVFCSLASCQAAVLGCQAAGCGCESSPCA